MDLKTYICRCCLNSVTDVMDLSAPMPENTNNDEVFTILQCLQNCTDITEADHFLMPQTICQLCFNDLKVSYYFRNKCHHSDRLLREQFMFQNMNQKEEPEPEFEKVDIKVEVEDEVMQIQIKEENLDSDDNDDEPKNSINPEFTTKTRKKDSNKQFICEICDKTYKTKLRLKEHFNTHTGKKPYKCEICDNEYAIKHSYQTHLKLHTQTKRYPCEFCEKVFYKKSALDTHRILHTGKTIPCPELNCGKMFCRTAELICHQRSHTNDRPYKCDKCSNSYRQKSDLNFHMHSHSNVKHTCEICHREYTAPGTLKVHMKSHQKVLPFNCTECDKGFTRKYRYRIHLKNCHDIDLDSLPKSND